jgi:hypothetical protein
MQIKNSLNCLRTANITEKQVKEVARPCRIPLKLKYKKRSEKKNE